MIEYCKHNLMKDECIFCLIESKGLNYIKTKNYRLFFKMWLNGKYGKFVEKREKNMIRNNQAIEFLKYSRERMIKSLKYIESIGSSIISIDLNGDFMCLNELDNMYLTSINTIELMMEKQEYSEKEIQYSNLVKLHCNLSYLDDINERRRKIKCILSRLKLRIKNIGKKTRLKINKKNLKICEIQQALWMYVLSNK